MNFVKFSLTAGLNLDRTHIQLDTAIALLVELQKPSSATMQSTIFATFLPSLFSSLPDVNTSSMIMLASAKRSDEFDSITGSKLVDYVPVLKCKGCGRRANDWRKGSTRDAQVRQCSAFDAIVAQFGELCPCGMSWSDDGK
jgi:hypothetical protein